MIRYLLIIALLFSLSVAEGLAPLPALAIGDDPPPSYDIIMLAGADYSLTLTLANNGTPIDQTGNTYVAQFRSAPGSSIFASYSCNSPAPVSGQIQCRLSKAQTLALSGKAGVWDLLLQSPSGTVEYLFGVGKAGVKPTSSRLP